MLQYIEKYCYYLNFHYEKRRIKDNYYTGRK